MVGVSIAAELAASVWSSLLLREEAPRLAAISGLGAAFFSACQAALRFNVDAIRLRVSDLRIIIASFAIAAAGFALVSVQAGFAASVAGFALIGIGTGPIVPCGFALAARQSAAGPAVGLASASLFSALTRLPAPLATGAIAQALSLPIAFAAFALALDHDSRRDRRRRFHEPRAAGRRAKRMTRRDGPGLGIALARPLLQRKRRWRFAIAPANPGNAMTKIMPVIMCGGSGTRMWPESRESLPKQFIPLIGQRSTFQSIVSLVSDPADIRPGGRHHEYRVSLSRRRAIEGDRRRGGDPARAGPAR